MMALCQISGVSKSLYFLSSEQFRATHQHIEIVKVKFQSKATFVKKIVLLWTDAPAAVGHLDRILFQCLNQEAGSFCRHN